MRTRRISGGAAVRCIRWLWIGGEIVMGQGFGREVANAMLVRVVALVLVTAALTATITACAFWLLTPTPESRARDAERRAIVERLTPREREILGVR